MSERWRYANVVLGAWLLASAFLWPHNPLQFRNTWSVGALSVVVAALALSVPLLRYGNALLGVWLLCTTIWAPRIAASTLWNNALVGVALAVFTLVPSGPGSTRSGMAPAGG